MSCHVSILEVPGRRWIEEASILEGLGRRWIDENSILEAPGRRWIDKNSVLGLPRPSPGGAGVTKIVLLASPPRATVPSRVASSGYPRPHLEHIFLMILNSSE